MVNCASLTNLYGNFLITGTRVFSGCNKLKINNDNIYNTNAVLSYPVPFVYNEYACNLQFDPMLNSTEEMFSGCTSLSGNDFTMIMLLLHQGITNLTKMFYNCTSANAVIKYDLFRHCPNAINISSFAEGAGIRGGIYSRTDDYDVNDTTTYGTFDFIRDVRSISNAFCNSSIEFLDTNIFAPYDRTYFGIQDADSVFASCRNLKSYGKASRTEMIEEGNLKSKTFFTNLRAIGNFPNQMFAGCTGVDMDIETLQIGDITYDYLFHWPTEINIRTINANIYSGINLKIIP